MALVVVETLRPEPGDTVISVNEEYLNDRIPVYTVSRPAAL